MGLGQMLSEQEERQWAEWEGTVVWVREQGDGLELELASGGQRRALVADASKLAPVRLWHNHIRARGCLPERLYHRGAKGSRRADGSG